MAEKKSADDRQDRLAKALRDNLKRRKTAKRKDAAASTEKPTGDGR